MLTENQFYISPTIREKIKEDPELYAFNLNTQPGTTPYYDYPYYLIENYKNLLLMLNIEEKKHEFIVNCVYYYLEQIDYYKNNDNKPLIIAKELAREDLKNIFNSYNNIPI